MMKDNITAELDDLTCGVIRPISPLPTYSTNHWSEVGQIIDDAIQMAGFEPRLVSDSNSTGIIHARIVANLYRNKIVVCDISGKNPNVMLELGMRLAFDKPVVVIKDDKTEYSFDTSPIEHLEYPASLHYSSIVDFKEQLSEKIKFTHENYGFSKSFLQQFGPIKVADLKEVEVPGYEIIREEIRELRNLVQNNQLPITENDGHVTGSLKSNSNTQTVLFFRKKLPEDKIAEVEELASKLSAVDRIAINFNDKRMIVRVKPNRLGGWDQQEANDAVRDLLRGYLVDIPLPRNNE